MPTGEQLDEADGDLIMALIAFAQLLPGVLQHAIPARNHRGLPVELAPPACDGGNEARAIQMVGEGANVEARQEQLPGRLCRLLLGSFAASRRPLLGELHQFVQRLAPWRGILVFSHESRFRRG